MWAATLSGQHVPIALRTLLLEGGLSVSTQEAVTTPANTAPKSVELALALGAWVVATTISAALALFGGARAGDVGPAAALALAPALAGFILLPRLGRSRLSDAGFLSVWIVTATGLAAGSGGAGSPLAVCLAGAPVLAVLLGRRWAPEAGAATVLAYAFAAWFSGFAPVVELGVFPQSMAVAAMAFAAGVLALAQQAMLRRAGVEKLAGERIAEVSHELRTPLTHILGFSEMIERAMFGALDARYVEYGGLIRRSGAHLLNLVTDLLDISRIEAGRYDLDIGDFDARLVVEDVVRLSVDAAEKKKIALGVVTPETPLRVRADAAALRRILLNTLGNALKFAPEGGRVLVRAGAADEALVLEVVDDGPGISPTERGQLGAPFVRGAAASGVEGTGLGLSLVRALAGMHGGALSLHDAQGGGALVRVTLPVLIPR